MSVEMAIDLKGVAELQRKLVRLDQDMLMYVDETLDSEVSSMRVLAQSLAPRRTGFLASTIFAERVGEWAFTLGAKAKYTYFVEFGTRFMRARRFLSRALESAMPSLVMHVNKAIEEAIVEASGT